MSEIKLEREAPLAPLTSWLVGGPAEILARPVNEEEVRAALRWAHAHKQPITILSGGTNVLISDQGVRGLVIVLDKLVGLATEERDGRLHMTAMAGTGKSELLKTLLKYKLEPALFLAGLPGDIGGGVAMNAGVGEMITPREFVEITDWIEVVKWTGADFERVRFARADLQWSYRHCEGWKPGVIVRVGLSWPLEPKADILQRVKAANQVRLSKQPLDMPSCGSVFINPPGHKSGQLIEQCGLKGYSVGGAQVSNKHANFIVNTGAATALDIHRVITHVRDTVKSRTGVELRTEVVFMGFDVNDNLKRHPAK